jgi:hypothetical protein
MHAREVWLLGYHQTARAHHVTGSSYTP